MQVFTYAERPDLSERTAEAESTFPEFLHHGEVTTRHWPRLREELPELQLVLYDEERDAVVGRGQTVPASARNGLPGGVDAVLEQRFGGGAPEEAEWEDSTGLEFPGDGDYVVPGALVPVRFEDGTGEYVEPNVWMRHAV